MPDLIRHPDIPNVLLYLDSGPFDEPFENLRVLSNVEGLRVPSLSRDFRRNDQWLRDTEKLASPEGKGFQPSPKGTRTTTSLKEQLYFR